MDGFSFFLSFFLSSVLNAQRLSTYQEYYQNNKCKFIIDQYKTVLKVSTDLNADLLTNSTSPKPLLRFGTDKNFVDVSINGDIYNLLAQKKDKTGAVVYRVDLHFDRKTCKVVAADTFAGTEFNYHDGKLLKDHFYRCKSQIESLLKSNMKTDSLIFFFHSGRWPINSCYF